MNSKNPIWSVVVICIAFAIIYLNTKNQLALGASLTVAILGSSFSKIRYGINYVWMKIAWVLSLIIPNVLLTIVFYTILFPTSLLRKIISNKDPLNLKDTKSTLFKNVDKLYTKESFENPW
jgi:ABC-type microcin C transport system permease subunit YejE